MTVRLYVYLPMPLTGRGVVSYTCAMLTQGMADRHMAVTIIAPRADHSPRLVPSVDVIEILPRWARYVPYRWVQDLARQKMESAFLSSMARSGSQTGAAYIWPDASPETIHELKRNNVMIFREMINCHTGTAKVILDQAYERFGVAPRHGITTESVQAERAALKAADYIFGPNALVEASLLENDVPSSKILQASYGWDPARFSGSDRLLPPAEGLTAVFVGTICVRKGAHLLLDYWAQSGITGRLVLAGEMEPVIKEKSSDLLARDDVLSLGYVKDIGALYRSADIFVFPSLEEGGPLVTYEACGCGLPVVTTPMGAGRIVRDNFEGFVIDPYDRDGWVAAIRTLAENIELRRTMAKASAERAQSFVWSEVAARRRSQILSAIETTIGC